MRIKKDKFFKKYKYFLLDWDGCLANTLEVWLNNYKTLYTEYDIEASEKEILKKSWGNREKGPKNFGIKKGRDFFRKLTVRMERDLVNVKLNEEAKELLVKIRAQKGKTCIVTSSNRYLVYPALQKHKLDKYIDALFAAEDVKKEKPNPEILNKGMEAIKARKDATLIIGDTNKDIQAGKNADIDTLLYYPVKNEKFYNNKVMYDLNPTYFIRDFKDLI